MTRRPLLLDLFCGAGGAAMGYHRAGFRVLGIDIDPQPNYPFQFIQTCALKTIKIIGHHADAIHASPPCQAYSTMTADPGRHARLIPVVRELVQRSSVPYVIENVEGAQRELINPVRLCGSSFGLAVRRHRYFETSVAILGVPCSHASQGVPVGVYGDHPEPNEYLRPGSGTRRGIKAKSLEHAREAMGIDWMKSYTELAQAIPPAYTEYIGAQLLDAVRSAA
jgi:DNA (cytosine-5)-methyltransferase 1